MDSSITTERFKQLRNQFICAGFQLILIGVFIYAVLLLVEASEDPHSDNVSEINSAIDRWEEFIPKFRDVQAKISPNSTQSYPLLANTVRDWHFKDSDVNDFEHLKFRGNMTLFQDSEVKFNYDEKDAKQYNITTDLTLRVTDTFGIIHEQLIRDVMIFRKRHYNLNMKMCMNHHTGIWDNDSHKCYYHYTTTLICFVVDEETWEPVAWYRQGCQQDGLESTKVIQYGYFDPPESLDWDVSVEVRSQLDPMVFAYKNNLVNPGPSAAELSVLGIALIIIAGLLSIIPLSFFCKRKRRSLLNHSAATEMVGGARLQFSNILQGKMSYNTSPNSPTSHKYQYLESKASKIRSSLKANLQGNHSLILKMQEDMKQAANTIMQLTSQKMRLRNALEQSLEKRQKYKTAIKRLREQYRVEEEKNFKLSENVEGLMRRSKQFEAMFQESQEKLKESTAEVASLKKVVQNLIDAVNVEYYDSGDWQQLLDADKMLRHEIESFQKQSSGEYTEPIIKDFITEGVFELAEKMMNSIFTDRKARLLWKYINQNWVDKLKTRTITKSLERLMNFVNQFFSDSIYEQAEIDRYQDKSVGTNDITETKASSVPSQKRYLEIEIPQNLDSSSEPNLSPIGGYFSPFIGSASRQDYDYSKIMGESDKLLENLQVHNTRLAQLNQQIYDTMTTSRHLLNSPSHQKFRDKKRISQDTNYKLDIAERRISAVSSQEFNLLDDLHTFQPQQPLSYSKSAKIIGERRQKISN